MAEQAALDSVRSAWEDVFNQRVDHDSDFFELGGDSLHALRVTNEIEQRLQVRPTIWLIMDHPRFADYAVAVERLLSAQQPGR